VHRSQTSCHGANSAPANKQLNYTGYLPHLHGEPAGDLKVCRPIAQEKGKGSGMGQSVAIIAPTGSQFSHTTRIKAPATEQKAAGRLFGGRSSFLRARGGIDQPTSKPLALNQAYQPHRWTSLGWILLPASLILARRILLTLLASAVASGAPSFRPR
jgi:hypothetical protein